MFFDFFVPLTKINVIEEYSFEDPTSLNEQNSELIIYLKDPLFI